MKKFRRILAVVLALSLASTLFVSCGKKQEASSDRMTIDWLMYCDGPMDKNAAVEKYFAEKFDVDFNVW